MTPEPSQRALLWLLLAALVIKSVYFVQYLALPILDGPVFDSLAYLRQANAIAAGRFGDASLLAFSPLYGYLLALTGAPENLARIVVLQLVLGCLNLVLVYQVAERLFDRRSAIVSSALYLSYGLLVFYETKVMAETLGFTLAWLTLSLCTSHAFVRGRLRIAIGTGVTLSFAMLARSNLLLIAPIVVMSLVVPWRLPDDRSWRIRLRRTLGCVLGLALVLLANGSWNYKNTGLFVPVVLRSETVGRASKTVWNGSLAAFSKRTDGYVGVFDVVAQAEKRLAGHVPKQVEAGIDWMGLLAGAPTKALATMRSVETDFEYGYYGERSELSIFALLFGSFGMLGVLAVVGVVSLLMTRRAALLIPLAPWAIGAFATTILVHPSSRYRLPIVLPMLLLAGVGAIWLWERRRGPRAWWILGPVVLGCAYFSYGTLAYQLADPAMWQLRMAESAFAAVDLEEAERRIARAEAIAGDKPHIKLRIAYLRGQLKDSPP